VSVRKVEMRREVKRKKQEGQGARARVVNKRDLTGATLPWQRKCGEIRYVHRNLEAAIPTSIT